MIELGFIYCLLVGDGLMGLRTKLKRAGATVFVPRTKRGRVLDRIRQEEQEEAEDNEAIRQSRRAFKREEAAAYARGRAEGARQKGRRDAMRGGGGGFAKAFDFVTSHPMDVGTVGSQFYLGGGGGGGKGKKRRRSEGLSVDDILG